MSFLAPLFAALLFASPCRAAVPPEVDGPVVDGIRAIYAMDFSGAEERFAQAKAAQSEHPYGYYGQAIVSWARHVYGSQMVDPESERRFESDVEASILKSKAWLKRHPEDAHVHLSLGGSYGLRSRLYVIQRRWLKALFDGRAAIKETRKAYALDPELKDALLGIGMYSYYADALPRFVSILGRVMGGDRLKGIQELEQAAAGGRYVGVGAKLILIEILTEDQWGAKDPARALSIIRELRKEFPKSPMFHQVEQVCQYEAGRHDELLASVDEYRKRIADKWAYYPESDQARMWVSSGTVHLARGEAAPAEEALKAAAALAGTRDAPQRWGVWGLVRLGNLYDMTGRRADAVAAYKEALRFPDAWGFRSRIKDYVGSAFKSNPHIGPLPPP